VKGLDFLYGTRKVPGVGDSQLRTSSETRFFAQKNLNFARN